MTDLDNPYLIAALAVFAWVWLGCFVNELRGVK